MAADYAECLAEVDGRLCLFPGDHSFSPGVDERVVPEGDPGRNLADLRASLGQASAEVIAVPVNDAGLTPLRPDTVPCCRYVSTWCISAWASPKRGRLQCRAPRLVPEHAVRPLGRA